MDELAVGATFADHVIRGVAGRGGMGIVYRALHVPLKREVALKVSRPEHLGDDGVPHALPARVRGRRVDPAPERDPDLPRGRAGRPPLRDDALRRRHRPRAADRGRDAAGPDPRRACSSRQVAAALDAAHRRGLVHRDVKPANVLIEAPASEHALLTDFGLTKFLHSDTQVTEPGRSSAPSTTPRPSSSTSSRSTPAPTSTRSAACSSRRSPARPVPARHARGQALRPPRVAAADRHRARARGPARARRRHRHARSPRTRRPLRDGQRPRPRRAGGRRRPSLARGVQRLAAGEPRPAGVRRHAAPARAASPLPARWPASSSGAFVGREDALDRLRARSRARSTGERQVVLLSGEPGIGKTRLATELARAAHADGATVLYGRCGPRVARPLPAVHHRGPALHRPPRDADAAGRARARAGRARPLRPRAAPHLPLREPIAEDGETRRYRLFEAVTRCSPSPRARRRRC